MVKNKEIVTGSQLVLTFRCHCLSCNKKMKREEMEINDAKVSANNADHATKFSLSRTMLTATAKKAKAAERIGLPRKR